MYLIDSVMPMQVVQHCQRGYTAVVIGWDRVCENISLLEDPDVNLVQPFYRVLTGEPEHLLGTIR